MISFSSDVLPSSSPGSGGVRGWSVAPTPAISAADESPKLEAEWPGALCRDQPKRQREASSALSLLTPSLIYILD